MEADLVVDLGNTAFKMAVFQHNILKEKKSIILSNQESENEIETNLKFFFKQYPIKRIIISTVIAEEKLKKIISFFPFRPLFLEDCTLPIQINYHPAQNLGKDRIANAVALNHLFPNEAALSIDLGTCIKYDFVQNNIFQGGIISPGYNMRLEGLHKFTELLPLLEPEEVPTTLNYGQDSKTCILIGTYEAIWAEINYFLGQFKLKNEGIKIVFTGGEMKYFENRIKSMIFAKVEPNLTTMGLHQILRYNYAK
jgi:type III pantothenate kinase